jgi:hypothetical protein
MISNNASAGNSSLGAAAFVAHVNLDVVAYGLDPIDLVEVQEHDLPLGLQENAVAESGSGASGRLLIDAGQTCLCVERGRQANAFLLGDFSTCGFSQPPNSRPFLHCLHGGLASDPTLTEPAHPPETAP